MSTPKTLSEENVLKSSCPNRSNLLPLIIFNQAIILSLEAAEKCLGTFIILQKECVANYALIIAESYLSRVTDEHRFLTNFSTTLLL